MVGVVVAVGVGVAVGVVVVVAVAVAVAVAVGVAVAVAVAVGIIGINNYAQPGDTRVKHEKANAIIDASPINDLPTVQG